jgi:hypothetical protein
MVSLSIIGMTGWVNPCCLAMRRPWTLSVLRRRSGGAFLLEHQRWCGTLSGSSFNAIPLGLDGPIGGFSPPEGRLAGGCKPPAFRRFLLPSARLDPGASRARFTWVGSNLNVLVCLY